VPHLDDAYRWCLRDRMQPHVPLPGDPPPFFERLEGRYCIAT
jgi:hypothetical protein